MISGDYNCSNYLGRMPNADKGNHFILRSELNQVLVLSHFFRVGVIYRFGETTKGIDLEELIHTGSKSRKYWSVLTLDCYLVSRPTAHSKKVFP